MSQLTLSLIPHEVDGQLVPQRARDGYINATAMCKAVGKNFADYRRLNTTQAFLGELSSVMGIPITSMRIMLTSAKWHEQMAERKRVS